jgi:class 3 adenylate cyclase/tetratricopeptide (TPR) repeat protein
LLLQRLETAPEERWWTVEGSVVFVDISGFTTLSERLARRGKEGAEQVTEAIETCFTTLLAVAYSNGGGLIKFGGDALLLLFDGTGHAERAARSAIHMRRMLREVGRVDLPGAKLQLRMSVGVHSGTFHFFLVGDSHRELLAVGPAWTHAVQMEHEARAGQILVSPETAAVLPARCVGRPSGPGSLLMREPPGERVDMDVGIEGLLPHGTERCLSVAVREHVLAGGGAPEHRPVTVAFVHFDGTDAMLETEGPEATASALDELIQHVQASVDEQGICFLGSDADADGGKLILAAGAPRVTGNDEERMLLALRRIAERPLIVPIRIGVNRGGVFAGDIGPSYRRTYTVMGDAVNLAARLMAKAGPGEVYATADVLERSNTRFASVELEPFSVKGKARPVRAWAVGEAIGSRAREEVAAERFPLVGRRQELTVIEELLSDVRTGVGHVIEIVGEPGIGKTRLTEETRLHARGWVTLHATCEAYTSTTPYVPWRDLLRQTLELGWEDPSDVVLQRLWSILERDDPDLLSWLPLVAIPFDVEVPPTLEVEMLALEFRRPKLHEVVIRFLRGQLSGPTLVEIEDAHLMDEASADLLGALARDLEGSPWLVVITRREDDTGFVAPGLPQVTRLDLGPLAPDAIGELARDATASRPMPRHVLELVEERSAGNPQFLLDLIGSAVSGDGSHLPESIEAAAMAQIDQLAPDDRAVVRRASVLGVSFHPRFLAGMSEEDERLPDEATWARLSGLFEEEGDGYLRFRRAVVRDAAYAGLPFRTRRRLHALAGARLELEVGADVEEVAGILSLHFLLADEFAKAWHYATAAGERAADMYANVEAARFLSRALEAGRRAGASPDELYAVAEALGDVRFRAGLYDVAARAYAEARKLCGDDLIRQAQLTYKRALIEENMGRFPRALRWIGRGRSLVTGADAEGAAGLSARLSARYAAILHAEGRMGDATRWARRAIDEAEAADAREALAEALNILGAADVMLGRPEGEDRWRRAERIYRELGDLPGQATLEANLGALAYFAGRWDEALTLYERAGEARLQSGDPVNAAGCSMNTAEVLLEQGRSAEAESILDDAARVYRAAGDRYDLGICLAFRGRAALRAGRVAEALSLLETARTEFEFVGAHGDALEVDARVAECLLFTGEAARALASASELSAKVKAEGGVSVLTPHLERVRGYALTQLGELREAREAFERSLSSARTLGADHEIALTLQASIRLGDLDGEPAPPRALEESGAILDRLGVIAVPAVPLRPGLRRGGTDGDGRVAAPSVGSVVRRRVS